MRAFSSPYGLYFCYIYRFKKIKFKKFKIFKAYCIKNNNNIYRAFNINILYFNYLIKTKGTKKYICTYTF